MHYLHHKVSSHIFQAFNFTLDEAGERRKSERRIKKPVNSKKKERRRKREVFYPHFDSNDDQVFSSYAIYRRRRKLNEALGENPLLLSIFQHENVCVHYTHVNQVMQCKKNPSMNNSIVENKTPTHEVLGGHILKTPLKKVCNFLNHDFLFLRCIELQWQKMCTQPKSWSCTQAKKIYLCAFKDCNFPNRIFTCTPQQGEKYFEKKSAKRGVMSKNLQLGTQRFQEMSICRM